MFLCVVVVLAVAGQASEENPLVRTVPFVDREEDELLFDTPDVGEGGHEGTVYHIPFLAVVLLLDPENREYCSTAFTHGVGTEFRENIGFFDSAGIADTLDLGHYLFYHVFVVVVHPKGILDGKAASDIKGVEIRAYGFQIAVDVYAFPSSFQ